MGVRRRFKKDTGHFLLCIFMICDSRQFTDSAWWILAPLPAVYTNETRCKIPAVITKPHISASYHNKSWFLAHTKSKPDVSGQEVLSTWSFKNSVSFLAVAFLPCRALESFVGSSSLSCQIREGECRGSCRKFYWSELNHMVSSSHQGNWKCILAGCLQGRKNRF